MTSCLDFLRSVLTACGMHEVQGEGDTSLTHGRSDMSNCIKDLVLACNTYTHDGPKKILLTFGLM
jgi:hypothetical protein